MLIKIDYSTKVREIVVRVNTSLKGYKGYLGQKDIKSRKVHLIYYKSSIWSQAERKYNAIKQEYKGVLKILRSYSPFLLDITLFLKPMRIYL